MARLTLRFSGLLYLVYPFVVYWVFASADSLLVFLPPVAINAGFAILFARTLLPRHEPMVSRFARIERGCLEPDLVPYTRRLTWVWVVFFVAMALVSGALALFGPRAAWVWFTGVGNYAGVVILFVGEYFYRRHRFAHYRHLSPIDLWHIVRNAMKRSA